ncbi:hypothetical protein [Candidatus Berkiella aquae]|uniref:Ankyrin repeats (3 copies) n=1 Tax=Candidatus Berkiella aquae TaxID=295108 RepID=A0A0Q9YZI5_9GAMM|nr:hypothetical protein [Candidatus Berkiella aquae]MCS5712652.1 hypothetical protein [Candidatus Berkiella aquae]
MLLEKAGARLDLNSIINHGKYKDHTILEAVVDKAFNGNLRPFEMLLEKAGAQLDLNSIINHGRYKDHTILEAVVDDALNGNSKLFEIVVEKAWAKIDLNVINNGRYKGFTIFDIAVERVLNGDLKFFEILLEKTGDLLDINSKMKIYKLEAVVDRAIDRAFGGKSRLFEMILEKAGEQLDVNSIREKGPYKGYSILGAIAKSACIRSNSKLLELILNKIDISKIDLNARDKLGYSILWRAVYLARKESPKLLELILAKADISTLDFNARHLEGCSVLWKVAELVSRYPELLGTILEKARPSILDFNVKNQRSKISVIELIVNAASKQPELFPLLRKAIFCTSLYGIKLVDFLNNDALQTCFTSLEEIKQYLHSKVSFLDEIKACSAVQIAALKLLENKEKVEKLKSQLAHGREGAMEDGDVSSANYHFTNTVKPHFEMQFLSYSATEDREECLLKIECEIRALILEAILEEAQEQGNEEVKQFIEKNKEQLIEGETSTMGASCQVLKLATPAHSAWRCYNPFAKVGNPHFPNLLTAPTSNREIYTTQASDPTGNANHAEDASKIVRERVAYYYLAVMDKLDGNESDRKNRIANFIGLLAEIRNTHGQDDPSCFPGHLTRIANMGHYHAVAQMPDSRDNIIQDYFRERVLALFKEEIEKRSSLKEKKRLLKALTALTEETAIDIVKQPAKYPDNMLEIRQQVIASLGSLENVVESVNAILAEKGLASIKQSSQSDGESLDRIKDERLIVLRYILDIARGQTNAALGLCFDKLTDSAPSVEDIASLNPFDAIVEEPAHQLFAELFGLLLEHMPTCRQSLHQSKNLAMCLQGKIQPLLDPSEDKQALLEEFCHHIMQDVQDEREATAEIIASLREKGLLSKDTEMMKNPFDDNVQRFERLFSMNPSMRQHLENARKKQGLFNEFMSNAQVNVEKGLLPRSVLKELIEAMVIQMVSDKEEILNQEKFLAENKDNPLFEKVNLNYIVGLIANAGREPMSDVKQQPEEEEPSPEQDKGKQKMRM